MKYTIGLIVVVILTIFTACNQDKTAPIVTINTDPSGNINFQLCVGDEYVEYGATASDNVDGDLTDQIQIINGDVDTSQPGSFVVAYSVTDEAGNATVRERQVTVIYCK